MADAEPIDNPQQEEIEPLESAEPEPRNGNHPVIIKEVTEKFKIPMTSRQAQAGGYSPRPQRPAKEESPSAKSSRNALDELMSRPESTDYRIIIHRYLPTYTDNGVKVPTGRVHETIVMPYDSLVDEVSRAWGGTSYRGIVCDSSGKPVPGVDAILINIPNCDPKLKKFDGMVPDEPAPEPTEEDELDRRAKELKKQADIDLQEERAAQARLRRIAAERKTEIEILNLEKLKREALGNNDAGGATALQAQITAMQAQFQETMRQEREAQETRRRQEYEMQEARRRELENQVREERLAAEKRREETDRLIREERLAAEKRHEEAERLRREERDRADQRAKEERAAIELQIKADREAADRRAAEERALNREMFKSLQDSLMRISETPKDTGMKEIMIALHQGNVAVQQSSQQMLGTLLPALIQKPPDDSANKMMEIVKMNNDSNRGIVEVAMRRDNKENGLQQQLVTTLLQSVLNPQRGGNELGPDMILKLIGEGRDQAERMFDRMQQIQQNNLPEPPSEDSGWDSKLGILGNAGKAIFSGLQETLRLAMTNPQIMQVVTQLFGKKQPTREEMLAYAYRAEQQQRHQQLPGGSAPPPLNPPPMQQQLPHYQPQYPPQQQEANMMPPPMMPPPVQNPLVTPPPAPAAQQPAQPAQEQPTAEQQAATQAEIDVATQMEGEATGVNVEQSEAPPEQQPAQAQQAPAQPQPPQQQLVLTPEQEASKQRLKDSVTNAISTAITDIVDAIEVREWPMEAHQYWHGGFKRALVNAPDDQTRMAMIEEMCDPATWEKLHSLIAQNGEELVKFYQGLATLVQMNRPGAVPVQG